MDHSHVTVINVSPFLDRSLYLVFYYIQQQFFSDHTLYLLYPEFPLYHLTLFT